MSSDASATRRPGARDVLHSLTRPKVAVMLLLGFASGLPFMLVGNTMGFWLREGGIELSTIGFLSWVGLAYSFKFLWAPIIDKVDAPLLGRWLGRRRGWMALAQLSIAAALTGMAIVRPEGGLVAFGVLALVAAFASATQDIVIDAWRIESADSGEELALLSSGYQLGYRASLLVTDALILILAAYIGWAVSYQTMAVLMGLGLLATFWAREPSASLRAATTHGSLLTARGLFDAIVGPFIAFFKQHGRWALLMLAAISLY
ncbi:MAG TPA: MFS transporter, partial [Lysobacter sp.]